MQGCKKTILQSKKKKRFDCKYQKGIMKKIKKKSYWCTYKLAEFAKDDWFRKWK